MNVKLRIIVSGSINLVIKLLNFIPLVTVNSPTITILNKIKRQVLPNLFDNNEFLSYVKKKKTGLEQNFGTIKTISLRGSNADYGFYSPLWKNSYNLGLTSSNLYTSYHLYNNYRNNLSELKHVIVYFTVFSTGYSLIRTSERYRAVPFKYFFDIEYESKDLINCDYENHILKKCKSIGEQKIEPNYMGYDKKTYFSTEISAQDRTRSHLRESKREPDQLNWLIKLRDLVNEDGRKLFIVIPPYRSDYKNLLPNDSTIFSKIYNIKGIEFLNYYNSKIFVDSDFGDTDHLNENGSIKLTNEIMQVFEMNDWL